MAILQGERIPWDACENSDSDSGSDVSSGALQGDTELKQLFASIKSTVTSLFRLSYVSMSIISTHLVTPTFLEWQFVTQRPRISV
jgi:hypothetical protein